MKNLLIITGILFLLNFILAIFINGGIYKKYAFSPCNVDEKIEKRIFLRKFETNNPDFEVWSTKLYFVCYWGLLPVFKTYRSSEEAFYLNVKYCGKDTSLRLIFKTENDPYGLSLDDCNSEVNLYNTKSTYVNIYNLDKTNEELLDSFFIKFK